MYAYFRTLIRFISIVYVLTIIFYLFKYLKKSAEKFFSRGSDYISYNIKKTVNKMPTTPPPAVPIATMRGIETPAYMRLSDGLACIPVFEGNTNVMSFIRAIERTATLLKWDDIVKLNAVFARISPAVREYLETNPALDNANNYESIIGALIERYNRKGPACLRQAKQEFKECRQRNGESVYDFSQRIWQLGLRTMPATTDDAKKLIYNAQTQESILEKFKDGILSKYAKFVWVSDPKTLSEAVDICERLELEDLSTTRHNYISAVEMPREQNLSHFYNPPGQQNKAIPVRTNQNITARCFSCNQVGHFRRNCRFGERNGNFQQRFNNNSRYNNNTSRFNNNNYTPTFNYPPRSNNQRFNNNYAQRNNYQQNGFNNRVFYQQPGNSNNYRSPSPINNQANNYRMQSSPGFRNQNTGTTGTSPSPIHRGFTQTQPQRHIRFADMPNNPAYHVRGVEAQTMQSQIQTEDRGETDNYTETYEQNLNRVMTTLGAHE